MKKSIFFFFFTLTINVAYAQFGFGKIEDVLTIKEVPLLIILETPNEKMIEKLENSDKQELEVYLKSVESFNKDIQEGFKNSWTFSNQISFISKNELNDYESGNNSGKYAYIKLDRDIGKSMSPLKSQGTITTFRYSIYVMGKVKPVYSFMYQDLPNSADFKFISQQIQNYLVKRENLKAGKKSRKELKREFENNAKKLKDKTLLLDKNDLSKDLIKQINKLYKFEFKLTSKEDIDSAILNNNDIAYLKIVPLYQATDTYGSGNTQVKNSKLIYIQYVMDASNGDILTFVQPATFGIGGATNKDSNNKMTVKDLKNVIKSIGK